MKKILLLFMLIISLNCFSANIPKNVDNQIRAWVKTTYPVDTYGSSAQKMMYDEETKNYVWLMQEVKSDEDKKIYKRVVNIYNPSQYGYTSLKMMYDEEKKNASW